MRETGHGEIPHAHGGGLAVANIAGPQFEAAGRIGTAGLGLLDPAAFMTPRRVTLSAWPHHVLFTFLVTALLRPRVIVELGMYDGLCHCAFCQAVDEQRLEAACCAVDTWRSDEHQTDWATTYPLCMAFGDLGARRDGHPAVKGPTKIGNNVSVGYRACLAFRSATARLLQLTRWLPGTFQLMQLPLVIRHG